MAEDGGFAMGYALGQDNGGGNSGGWGNFGEGLWAVIITTMATRPEREVTPTALSPCTRVGSRI